MTPQFYFVFYIEKKIPFRKSLFICLLLAPLALGCCAWALSRCGELGPLLVSVQRLLIELVALAVEHRLQQLRHAGSAAAACGLGSCSCCL